MTSRLIMPSLLASIWAKASYRKFHPGWFLVSRVENQTCCFAVGIERMCVSLFEENKEGFDLSFFCYTYKKMSLVSLLQTAKIEWMVPHAQQHLAAEFPGPWQPWRWKDVAGAQFCFKDQEGQSYGVRFKQFWFCRSLVDRFLSKTIIHHRIWISYPQHILKHSIDIWIHYILYPIVVLGCPKKWEPTGRTQQPITHTLKKIKAGCRTTKSKYRYYIQHIADIAS